MLGLCPNPGLPTAPKALGEARWGSLFCLQGLQKGVLLDDFAEQETNGAEAYRPQASSQPSSLLPRAPPPVASLSSLLCSGRWEKKEGKEGERLETDIPWAEAMCGSSRRIPLFVNGICLFTSQATSQIFCKLSSTNRGWQVT